MKNLRIAVNKLMDRVRDEFPEEEATSHNTPVEKALREVTIPNPSCLDLIRKGIHAPIQEDAFNAGVAWAREQLR